MEAFVDGVIAAQLESLHLPGAVIAVVADGKLYFAKGYGYADHRERSEGQPGNNPVPNRLDHQTVHLHGSYATGGAGQARSEDGCEHIS